MRHLFTFLLVGAFASSCIKTDLPAIIPTVTNPAADMNFSIKIIFNDSNASGYILDKYHDEGTFELDVKNNLVSVPQDKIQNFVPTDTPVSFVYGNTKVDYLVDSFGVINVKGERTSKRTKLKKGYESKGFNERIEKKAKENEKEKKM